MFISFWLGIQFISSGLEAALSHTDESCIVLYYRKLSKNSKIPMDLSHSKKSQNKRLKFFCAKSEKKTLGPTMYIQFSQKEIAQ